MDIPYPDCNFVVYDPKNGFLQENGEYAFNLKDVDLMPEATARHKAIFESSIARCFSFEKAVEILDNLNK